jgi:hypothetical protein
MMSVLALNGGGVFEKRPLTMVLSNVLGSRVLQPLLEAISLNAASDGFVARI